MIKKETFIENVKQSENKISVYSTHNVIVAFDLIINLTN